MKFLKLRQKSEVVGEVIQKSSRPKCPNCESKLKSPFLECKLCGWEREKCLYYDECLWRKQSIQNCTMNLCGIYEPMSEEEIQKRKREEEIQNIEERSRYISKSVQREVWRRDQGRCVECGSNELLEFDHIIPFSKGGSNTARNIQLLCENCNRKKQNRI